MQLFQTTAINKGAPVPAPSGDLFRLNSFFLTQDTWDPNDDSAVRSVVLDNQVGYSYAGGLATHEVVETPSLRGEYHGSWP